jgi:hypothetical protein
MQTIQEIYTVLIQPLPENERLKLIELIVKDMTHQKPKRENKKGIREMFGMWQGKELTYDEYLQLDHNERIDFDLGRAYSDNHEDEN